MDVMRMLENAEARAALLPKWLTRAGENAMSPKVERTIMARAYKLLLGLPLDSPSRARIQPALASLRDEIARMDGATPESIQAQFEKNPNQ